MKKWCLSFPGLFLKVQRPKEVVTEFTDSNGELQTATLHKPFDFTKDVPVLKINRIERKTDGGYKGFEDTKSALYNLTDDPGQLSPINDEVKSKEYQKIMMDIINEYDPPHELIKNYFKNN